VPCIILVIMVMGSLAHIRLFFENHAFGTATVGEKGFFVADVKVEEKIIAIVVAFGLQIFFK